MLSSLVYSCSLFAYVLSSISIKVSHAFKFGVFITRAMGIILLFDYLMGLAFNVDWLNVQFIHLLCFAEIFIFHTLSINKVRKIDRVVYQPLLLFSFSLLMFNNMNEGNFSIFLIGAMVIEFLLKQKRRNLDNPWSELLPLIFLSFILIFYQFNEQLKWTSILPLLVYIFFSKRIPLPLKEFGLRPFRYPLVARTVLYGLLTTKIINGLSNQYLMIAAAVCTSFLLIIQMNSRDTLLKWSLYNRSLEGVYLICVLSLGWHIRSVDTFSMFYILSFATMLPFTFSRIEKNSPRLMTFFLGLIILLTSGLAFGPTEKFFSNLVEYVVQNGLNSYYISLLVLVSAVSVSFYIPNSRRGYNKFTAM